MAHVTPRSVRNASLLPREHEDRNPNTPTNMFTGLRFSLALCLLASTAQASVWTVDDDPGADFTDIQAAIDGASPGDVIRVEPGSYSPFSLGFGLTILASDPSGAAVSVSGSSLVVGVAGNQTAVLSGLELDQLEVGGCAAPVLLDSLELHHLSVGTALDVRVLDTQIHSNEYGGGAATVAAARVEFVRCSLRGRAGEYADCYGVYAGDGGTALTVSNGGKILATRSEFIGGDGGDTDQFCEWNEAYGGDGGHGVLLRDISEMLLAGKSTDLVQGGREGWGEWVPGLYNDGEPGFGIQLLESASVRYSGVDVADVDLNMSATAESPSPADPYLTVTGTFQGGREVTFAVNGNPGATARLYLGRRADILPFPGTHVEQLSTRERTFGLGNIPASGTATFTFNLPGWMWQGFSFVAQAETFEGADLRLTNSFPLVIRYD